MLLPWSTPGEVRNHATQSGPRPGPRDHDVPGLYVRSAIRHRSSL